VGNIVNRSVSQETLIIRLGGYATDPIYWYMNTQDEKNRKYGRMNSYTELKNISLYFNCTVKVLVSTSRVIFRRIDIKNSKIKKNIKSMAYAIEQSIVGDIDDFHIVILKYDGDFCYVAVIEHELMNLWLNGLKNAGISTEAIIPDVLTLPFSSEEGGAVKLDNEWLIRDSEMSGFSIRENLLEKLSLSRFPSIFANAFSFSDDKSINWQSAQYCEALSIMAKNIGDCDVNFISGKYNHHKGRLVTSDYLFKTVCLCLLLSITICLNYWIGKYKIVRDIDMLNLVSTYFYTDFFPVNKEDTNDISDFSDAISNYNGNEFYSNFIGLLHASGNVIDSMDVSVNSIYFEKNNQMITFNITMVGDATIGRELNDIETTSTNFNVVTVNNDNGTYDVMFKYCP
jgi:general secretion pathway protein L